MSAGAPLADVKGKLLAVIIAKETSNRPPTGMSLAVPATYVRQLIEARQGEDLVVIHRAFLGISLKEQTTDDGKWVVVSGVGTGSAAEEAGVLQGDRIEKIDGKKVSSVDELTRLVGRRKAGEKIAVSIRRGDLRQRLQITAGRARRGPQDSVSSTRFYPSPAPSAVDRVRPSKIYYLGPNGSLNQMTLSRVPLTFRDNGPSPPEYVPVQPSAPSASAIRVQRTDVEKKLDQLSAEVQALREQIEQLTEELEGRRQQDQR
jgi:membrane-associated protease RseP (regulator of RpoE activity)